MMVKFFIDYLIFVNKTLSIHIADSCVLKNVFVSYGHMMTKTTKDYVSKKVG